MEKRSAMDGKLTQQHLVSLGQSDESFVLAFKTLRCAPHGKNHDHQAHHDSDSGTDQGEEEDVVHAVSMPVWSGAAHPGGYVNDRGITRTVFESCKRFQGKMLGRWRDDNFAHPAPGVDLTKVEALREMKGCETTSTSL